jgi:hypothetical protein
MLANFGIGTLASGDTSVNGGPHDMGRAGMTATFEQAHAELSGNWDK